jgi:Fe2+ transport system protein FeoA
MMELIKKMLTINDLAPGSNAVIKAITASGEVRQRFMDLGLFEGARVEMLCCAPLGDPVLVRVLGTMLALRRTEAATIEIEEFHKGECHTCGKQHRHRAGR